MRWHTCVNAHTLPLHLSFSHTRCQGWFIRWRSTGSESFGEIDGFQVRNQETECCWHGAFQRRPDQIWFTVGSAASVPTMWEGLNSLKLCFIAGQPSEQKHGNARRPHTRYNTAAVRKVCLWLNEIILLVWSPGRCWGRCFVFEGCCAFMISQQRGNSAKEQWTSLVWGFDGHTALCLNNYCSYVFKYPSQAASKPVKKKQEFDSKHGECSQTLLDSFRTFPYQVL